MQEGGVNYLRGAMRELFVSGVVEACGCFINDSESREDAILDDWIGWQSERCNEPYERLEPTEKVYALAEVARALTTKSEPPTPTQWSEATIYAVFETIAEAVEGEICWCSDDDDFARSHCSHTWRLRVAAAERQTRELLDDEDEYIHVESDDIDEWRRVVLGLSEEILWDLDFLDNELPDLPPQASQGAHQMFGINSDYYTDTVPVVTEERLSEAERFLKKLAKKI